MSITAKELAKQLGLSPSAVSIALNNKPGISTETRKKILDAARVSNYDFSKIGEKKTTAGTIYFLIYIKDGAVVYKIRLSHRFRKVLPPPAHSMNTNCWYGISMKKGTF